MSGVSIVIDNYNNAGYLRESIDSALAQQGTDAEVIAVDDGSTDGSQEVIRSYGERLTPVLKENGGQGSALNAGFAASRGEVVIFLDSDDRLEPWAAHTAVEALRSQPHAAKLQWPLRVIDAAGMPTGEFYNADVEAGDLRARVLAGGPYSYHWAATSGNAWQRRVLDEIMPIDEAAFAVYVDSYLCGLAPLFGPVLACESMSCWREHASNYTALLRPFDERLREWVARFDAIFTVTEHHASRLGLPFDRDAWLAASWFHRIDRAVRVIDANVPEGVPVILVDDDEWEVGGSMHGRSCLPFPERGGQYAGRPADKREAVAALEAMTASRNTAVAVAWPAFWWLDYYGLGRFLAERFRPVAETPDICLFLDRALRFGSWPTVR